MKRPAFIFLSILFCFADAAAGDRPGIRGIGMARTVNAVSRGLAALGVNPANLGMRGEVGAGMYLLPLSIDLSSEFLSYDLYREYFTGVPGPDGTRQPRFLTDTDKQRLLSAFPDETASSRFGFGIMSIGVSYLHPDVGGFAAGVTDHIGGRVEVPRDFLKLLLFGLDSLGSRFDSDQTRFEAWWWREWNLSFGRNVPIDLPYGAELYAGIGIKYLAGYGVIHTDRYRSRIASERVSGNQYRTDFALDYVIRKSGSETMDPGSSGGAFTFTPYPAGSGWGVDLGLAVVAGGVEVHLGITDIGSISWSRNLRELYGDYQSTITDPFLGTAEDSLELAVHGQNRLGAPFSTSLPAAIRLGAAIGSDSVQAPEWLPRRLTVALDLSLGLNESLGNTKSLRASVGIEYGGLSWLPVRTGWALGEDGKLRWAVGFSVESRSFSWDVGTENIGLLFSSDDFDFYSFATGFRFRF